MKVINPEEVETFVPADHFNMISRTLVGKEIGATKISVGLGTIRPGGGSAKHSHENSEQCHYVLRGELTVTTEQGTKIIQAGMVGWTAAGEDHEVRNNGKEDAHYLVITAPPS